MVLQIDTLISSGDVSITYLFKSKLIKSEVSFILYILFFGEQNLKMATIYAVVPK